MKSYEGWSPDAGLDFIATLHRRVFIRVAYTVIYMENTEKNPTEMNISCRMSINDIKHIDLLAETGEFMNRSDVIRTAIRDYLRTR